MKTVCLWIGVVMAFWFPGGGCVTGSHGNNASSFGNTSDVTISGITIEENKKVVSELVEDIGNDRGIGEALMTETSKEQHVGPAMTDLMTPDPMTTVPMTTGQFASNIALLNTEPTLISSLSFLVFALIIYMALLLVCYHLGKNLKLSQFFTILGSVCATVLAVELLLGLVILWRHIRLIELAMLLVFQPIILVPFIIWKLVLSIQLEANGGKLTDKTESKVTLMTDENHLVWHETTAMTTRDCRWNECMSLKRGYTSETRPWVLNEAI